MGLGAWFSKRSFARRVIQHTERALSGLMFDNPVNTFSVTISVTHTMMDGISSTNTAIQSTIDQLNSQLKLLAEMASSTTSKDPSAFITTIDRINHLSQMLYEQRYDHKLPLSKEFYIAMVVQVQQTEHIMTYTSTFKHHIKV